MKRVAKAQKPPVLEANEATWTDEYLAYVRGDPGVPKAAATRYRHPQIKDALKVESGSKCVYCESSLLHNQRGDCEHILPKSRRPELIVAWENLALVCRLCNDIKGEYYDPSQPLLNPFADEPAGHLRFAGALCFAQVGSDLGRRTRRVLMLDRPELLERRGDRLRRIGEMLESWSTLPAGTERDIARREIELEAREGEYATACAQLLRDLMGWP
jgi:5-methylcytosine-specific restriction endonuclease McrA